MEVDVEAHQVSERKGKLRKSTIGRKVAKARDMTNRRMEESQGQRELRLFNLRNRNSQQIKTEPIEQATARRFKNIIRTSLQGVMNRKRNMHPVD